MKLKERERHEEFETGGTSHWNSTMRSFQELENQKKKKGDLGIPGSNFRDNDKFPRALGGLECCTSSSQHLEHIYPSNTSWQLELKIASLDKLESGGEKKKIPDGMFIFGKSQRRKRKGRGSMRYLEHVRK